MFAGNRATLRGCGCKRQYRSHMRHKSVRNVAQTFAVDCTYHLFSVAAEDSRLYTLISVTAKDS